MPTTRTPPQRARDALGAAVRRGDPPETIAQLRRELEAANLTAAIEAAREQVAPWPLFSDEKIAELTLLLRGEPNGQGT